MVVETFISKAFLHSGRDLVLNNKVTVKHPKMSDILAINDGFVCDAIYWSYVNSLLSDPYDNMVFLDDNHIDYELVTPFDVFVLRWLQPGGHDTLSAALQFFLGPHDFTVRRIDESEWAVYDKNDESYCFGSSVFSWLVQFINDINCIVRTDKIHPADKTAKRILIEDMRDEQKRRMRKRRQEDDDLNVLGDVITAAIYGGSGVITPFNFDQLPIYQLMCGGLTSHKRLRVGAMMNGIYTGMLNADKLPQDELRWV